MCVNRTNAVDLVNEISPESPLHVVVVWVIVQPDLP